LQYIEPIPGDGCFVDIETGKEVEGARHTGIHNFTIGKRISSTNGCNLPIIWPNRDGLYVVELDSAKQIVYFVRFYYLNIFLLCNLSLIKIEKSNFLQCHGSYHRRLFARRIALSQPHWISGISILVSISIIFNIRLIY
jgi:tRNA U34 2-thiouridine synthase MnmA/TrmU